MLALVFYSFISNVFSMAIYVLISFGFRNSFHLVTTLQTCQRRHSLSLEMNVKIVVIFYLGIKLVLESSNFIDSEINIEKCASPLSSFCERIFKFDFQKRIFESLKPVNPIKVKQKIGDIIILLSFILISSGRLRERLQTEIT